MTDKIDATQGRRLLGRFLTIIMVLVGLIFSIVGGVLLIGQGWDRVAATVGACTVQGTAASPRIPHQICDVTWESDGTTHSASIDLGTRVRYPGDTVDLRVNGNIVVEALPVWVGATTLALGLLLLVIVILRRLRTKPTSD